MLFIEFHTIVVRDRIPVDAAHREFLKINGPAAALRRTFPVLTEAAPLGRSIESLGSGANPC